MGLDDIDEIDTNNMAIYSGPAKKKLRSSRFFPENEDGSNFVKQEPTQADSVNISKLQTPGKSLLIPSSNNAGEKSQNNNNPNIMIKILNDEVTNDATDVGTSQNVASASVDPLVAPINYDETSQVRRKNSINE